MPERPERYRKASAIFLEKTTAQSFFEVLSGSVRCSIMSPEGRRQILRFAGPTDIIGLTSEESHSYSAEVVRSCTVRRYRNDLIDLTLARDVDLRHRVFVSTKREIDSLWGHMALLHGRHSISRVAALILEMEKETTESCGRLPFPASRSDMADYLCMSPETLCRKLGELRLSRLIEMPSAHEVLILHRQGLETIAAKG